MQARTFRSGQVFIKAHKSLERTRELCLSTKVQLWSRRKDD